MRRAPLISGSSGHQLVAEQRMQHLAREYAARIFPMTLENKRTKDRIRNEVLTPYQVAEILQLNFRTVIRRFEDGTIPAKKIGSKWRCSRKNLDTYLDSTNELS
ncbi:helix-turn-helix domain-containing protein [Granulicella sp. L60]|uniref:helix-turn-helix domain-containing protein n=1 Tax=Granulicella sp. L60 TaxID=1641866 RepID=UPI00352A9927